MAHSERFAVEPRSEHDVHRPLRPGEDLNQILSWQEERKLSKNLMLRYKKTLLLVEPSPDTQRLAGRRAQIYEWEDGHLDVVMDGRSLPFRVFDTRGHVSQAAVLENKRLGAALAHVQELQQARDTLPVYAGAKPRRSRAPLGPRHRFPPKKTGRSLQSPRVPLGHPRVRAPAQTNQSTASDVSFGPRLDDA